SLGRYRPQNGRRPPRPRRRRSNHPERLRRLGRSHGPQGSRDPCLPNATTRITPHCRVHLMPKGSTRLNSRLEAEGAEFLVLANLLIEGIYTTKAYTRYPGYDLVAADPNNGTSCRIQ